MKESLLADRNKFIDDFDRSYQVYEKNKKDYFYVKLIYEHFCQNNVDIKNEIKITKFKSILNTYRTNKNHDFSINKYKTCEFFWTNLNLYILSILAQAFEYVLKEKNEYQKGLDSLIEQNLLNCEKIVDDLKIGNSKIGKGNSISKSINYLKKLFNDLKPGRI
tara:strand:- start:573 stop:1061 length:489 start_codon:yes stop_codon:yes gene_type:complete